MLEAFRNDAKRQRLHARDRFVAVCAVTHHAWQRRHVGQPATVIFSLKLNRKNHTGTVPPGQTPNKRITGDSTSLVALWLYIVRQRIARVNASLAFRSALRGIDPGDPLPNPGHLPKRHHV